MPKHSAGLVQYGFRQGVLYALVAHPGGPCFEKKDAGHWTIPKGEIDPGEDPLAAAIREFTEETGYAPPSDAEYQPLGDILQKNNKIVTAWGFAGDWPDEQPCRSNLFRMEWPPKSGKTIEVPEIDRVAFRPIPEARKLLRKTQWPLLERLENSVCEHPAG